MGMFDHFPYTNFHELNLDWILQALKEIERTMDQFVSMNTIKYADPIQWDITRQYEKNTIVIDPLTGTAYISVQAVPYGVALSNTDYWSVIFDLEQITGKTNYNLTDHVEAVTTTTASFPTSQNGWLIWGGYLYKALVNITAGDRYVEDSNIKRITIEDVTGHVEDLLTTNKSNLVNAINELFNGISAVITDIGNLTDLNTTDKSSVISAINEVLQDITDKVGNLNDLDTVDKSNAVAAINEVLQSVGNVINIIGDLTDLNTTDKSSVIASINEVLQDITDKVGNLNDLDTVDKSNAVAAINEVLGTALADINDLIDGVTAFNTLNAVGNLKFKAPNHYSRYFDMLPYTDPNGVTHNILTAGSDIDYVGSGMYINVLLYGADNTGATETSAAIQAAIDYATTLPDGGVVYLPAGTYKINTALRLKDKVSLLGDGMIATFLNVEDSHVGIDAHSNAIGGCFIKGMKIWRSTPDTAPSYPALLQWAGILFGCTVEEYNQAIFEIKDVSIRNFTNGVSGGYFHSTQNAIGLFDSILDNVWCVDCAWAGVALGGSGNQLRHLRIVNCSSGIAFIRISDESFDGDIILGSIFIGNGYDITFRDAGMYRPIRFINTWFEQSKSGIINVPFSGTRPMSFALVGCMLNSNTTQFDLFTCTTFTGGIIELENCTAYQTVAGGNNNITLPATTTAVKGVAVNCVKIASNGAYMIYEDLT